MPSVPHLGSLNHSPRRHQPYAYAARGLSQLRPLSSTAMTTGSPNASGVIPVTVRTPPVLAVPRGPLIRPDSTPLPPAPAPAAPSADLQARIIELEGIKASLMLANDRLSARLNKVCDAVTEAVVCTICTGYSKKIYSLRGCGHSVCLSCLSKEFTNKLAANLSASRFAKWSVPRTTHERDQLWKAIRRSQRGIVPAVADARAIRTARHMFTYPCPFCRTPVMNTPQEVHTGRVLCDAFKIYIYPEMPREERPHEVERIALGELAPLFLTAEAVVQEVTH